LKITLRKKQRLLSARTNFLSSHQNNHHETSHHFNPLFSFATASLGQQQPASSSFKNIFS
jgi:hypothetical protein